MKESGSEHSRPHAALAPHFPTAVLPRRLPGALRVLIAGLLVAPGGMPASPPAPPWSSPARCRVLLRVDARGQSRSNSPASVELDFQRRLSDLGIRGRFDEDTLEIAALDVAGRPRI